MTFGPRMTISPSAIRISCPASGTPMEPTLRRSRGLIELAQVPSVRPKPSMMGARKRRSKRAKTSTGIGAAPQMQNRSRERSYRSAPGVSFRIA